MEEKKVGFVGFGKMAQAIWLGIEQKRVVRPSNVRFCTKTKYQINNKNQHKRNH